MIRFFYNAGSDKTKEALIAHVSEDLAAGQKAILLVPEQETVSVERRMLECFPPSAQLRFEVLNFSRLANRVFRTLGGLSHRAATPAISALFMWQALREVGEQLRQYKVADAKDSALCDLMLATAAQCKGACISAEQLLEASESIQNNEPLANKIHDIGLILSTYELRLGERFDNGADDLTRLATLLDKQGKTVLADTHVYVDSFTDFTKQELLVLEGVAKSAPTLSVTFPLEGSHVKNGLHLAAALHTHDKLFAMAKKLGKNPIKECEGASRPTDAVRYLTKHLYNMSAEPAPLSMAESGQINLCECDSPFEEASAIADRIHRLIRAGYRYRDIAVVVRDATSWNGILDDAFEREGIPCFISEKSDITLRPLVKLIMQALRIHLRNWRVEDVVGYLKTNLCGVSPDDVNLFEEYVHVWAPKGKKAYTSGPFTKNPDGYKAEISERGMRIRDAANRVKDRIVPPLINLFTALEKAENATESCEAIYAFLNVLDIREKLKEQAKERLLAGERRDAEELSRLYNVTVDALEAIANAMGTVRLKPNELTDALKIVFSRTDIGSIPTSADEVVIGSASMLRADHPRVVLIAGLNDGKFPATVTDSGLISEQDRRQLEPHDVVFPFDNEKLVSDEMFYLYRAFSAPRDSLYLYHAKHGTDGRALSPSMGVTRIKTLFPTLKETKFADVPPIERIFTQRGVAELYTELKKSERALLAPLGVTEGLERGDAVDRNAYIDPEAAKRLFARGRFNPTHLENYASCRFKYYCGKILRLREEASGAMSSAETGSFIHHVLEHVMNSVIENKRSFKDYDAQSRSALVTEICDAYRRELIEAGGELTPRTQALFQRLSKLAELIVSGLFAEFTDSLFTPAFLELSLSDIGENASISLPDGEQIPLSGQIDRVDYWQDETGRVYLRVTDYKTGSKSFKLEDIEKGFCLQMPLYLLALCRGRHNALCKRLGLPEDTAFLPAGVTYLSSNISVENTDARKDEAQAMEDAVDRLTREGLLLNDPDVKYAMSLSGNKNILGSDRSKTKTDLSGEGFEELFHLLEGSITRIAKNMRSGAAEIKPNPQGGKSPCDYCPYIAVCRAAKKSKE